ncbi:energy-coupling factor transporter transmembrane component T family protein [Nigerium massiliense]|uniref:energy-coupling factor transporter transmembrane component T family protein n=1 Tax=Nigerium massiliense TaxID=1522317 RepID=UPI00058AD1FD|nr:energy-coupling factor transporter transmembrane protein EcfT [Nigerium massiliense]
MNTGTLGLYRPGTSPLHRARAGTKLLGLAALGLGSVFLTTWQTVTAALALVVALYAVAGLPPRTMLRQVRPMLFIVVFVAVFHVWTAGWVRAYEVLGVILLLVLAAALVTLTTPVSAMVDAVVAAAGGLRRFGVDPERLGLILMLGIRCVPLMSTLVAEVREAQSARGTRSLRAFAVPLIVRALREADAMGEALVARGVDD